MASVLNLKEVKSYLVENRRGRSTSDDRHNRQSFELFLGFKVAQPSQPLAVARATRLSTKVNNCECLPRPKCARFPACDFEPW